MSEFKRRILVLCAFAMVLSQVVGCARRTEDDFDDRTLGQRPHVETMKPEDRKDIFRP